MEQQLSHYKVFYEVARTGNISKAAKELYISQPAVSKSISKLEDSLGVPLFIRGSRGVRLTAEGELLFRHAQTAFEMLGQGERELKRIHDFNIGQIRIGVSNTLCRFIMLPYLKEFIHQFPHIKIHIESQSSTHTLTMLEQEQIDIGLVAAPRSMKNMEFIPEMEIEDIFVAAPNYLENFKLREGADADIFQLGNIMLLDRGNLTRRHIDSYMNEHQIEVNNLLEVTAMDLLIEFARIGLGAACVIKEFVKEDIINGSLVQLPLNISIRKRTIGFAYHSNRSSKALQTFIDFCKNNNYNDNSAPLLRRTF